MLKILHTAIFAITASAIFSDATVAQTLRDTIANQRGNVLWSTQDLSSNWTNTPRFLAQNFSINGNLGGTVGNRTSIRLSDRWDSSDRLRFYVPRQTFIGIATDPNVITELVRFDNGVPTVVASTEYGTSLTANLPPGQYGLSFFVEGDLINYSASVSFR